MIRKEFPLIDKEGRIAEIPNGVAPWLFYEGELYLGRVRESHVHLAKRIWVEDHAKEVLENASWGTTWLKDLEPIKDWRYIPGCKRHSDQEIGKAFE